MTVVDRRKILAPGEAMDQDLLGGAGDDHALLHQRSTDACQHPSRGREGLAHGQIAYARS